MLKLDDGFVNQQYDGMRDKKRTVAFLLLLICEMTTATYAVKCD